ncbi:MAG TPA: DUF5597 domain-containing protein [Bacteroidales bacterium]|nr:DUF5597 domain-containing protein [Bacteroidales bacterium]
MLRCFIRFFISVILLLSLFVRCDFEPGKKKQTPHLEKRGEAVQLVIDGKPFLALAGELSNSSSSSRDYMKDIWPRLQASGMNTVLAAVEWSLVEPEEGVFDFSLVDGLIKDARSYNLRLMLLWFGSWKNGQSHFIPGWVKKDYQRFSRVKAGNNKSLEILSVFCKETLEADAGAFAQMMKHIRKTDSLYQTVIMIQVQNEVGILGSTRDFSESANEAFYGPVPSDLMEYLAKNKENLLPELIKTWADHGYKTSGTWQEVFGKGVNTDELFMAWSYSRFVDHCAKVAKAEYNIPMYVNTWIIQPGDRGPGDYPSGGSQSHVMDIWRAGAPNIDLYCPDIYLPDFIKICEMYTRSGNPLFIPESRAGEQGVGQLFYAIGKHKAIGYSPFGIDGRIKDIESDPIAKAYKLLSGMAPVILDAQSKGTISGVLLKRDVNPKEEIEMGGYNLLVELLKSRRSDTIPSQGYGIIIHSDTDEYVIAGHHIQVSFSPVTEGPAIAAIEKVDEGTFVNGQWIPRRRLNGDDIMIDYDLAKKVLENKTGTGLKFTGDDRNIQKVKLYRYE